MKRLLLLGCLVYCLLLAGLAAREHGLLALALLPAVYLGAAVFLRPEAPRLKVSRTLSHDRATEGAHTTVRLSIANQGRRLEHLSLEDTVPARLKVAAGHSRASAALGPGESLSLEYDVRGVRGLFEFLTLRVAAHDALGLSVRVQEVEAPAILTVLPRVTRMRRLAIRPLRTRGHAGPVPARTGGPGTDFFGVRDYLPGDPQRWINWRASARSPSELFSNEFEQERLADVGLILDARFRSDIHANGDSLLEHAIRATASLADSFLRDGNRVGLLVFGQQAYRTYPGYGKVQRERILRALCRAEPGDSRVVDSLEYLPVRFLPAQSQVVLVSPVWKDDVPVLLSLRARGYQLLVIRPDSVSFELGGLPSGCEVELAARVRRAEGLLVRRRLQAAGVQVVDWPVDRLLDQVVHASLGRVPPWHRALRLQA
jgi:uncharacterized protein (DUF58 family)